MAKQHAPGFLKLSEQAKLEVKQTTVAEVKERLERNEAVILIDVREDHEWNEGYIPGALHLGKGVIERDIERLIPRLDTEVVLYCGGGHRSALAAQSIQKMGYANAVSMEGGISSWKEARYPVAKP